MHPLSSVPRASVLSKGMRKSVATSVLSLSFFSVPASWSPHSPLADPSRMPGMNSHRTFFHQSGVVTERGGGGAISTQIPTPYINPVYKTKLSLSLQTLLVRSERHLTSWRGIAVQLNAGMQPSSNSKRIVIFRTRLRPKQNEAGDVVGH